MEGLFFVIEPIWWISSIQITSWIATLIGGLCIMIFLWYRNRKITQRIHTNQHIYTFDAIDPIDPKYAEKTLIQIRKYLTYQYVPIHSWAHTPHDIMKYSTNIQLINIIQELEKIEYTNHLIEKNHGKIINRELITLLQP